MAIEYKSLEQIRVMRKAGLVVAQMHKALREAIRPGVTTGQLDEVARDVLAAAGATSNFLGYYGFPAVVCASVNEEIVHGIPGERVLNEGDIVSLDCGAIVDGWHSDAAFTAPVGACGQEPQLLMRATEESMWAAIAALATGKSISDVGAAVEETVRKYGREHGVKLGIVREFVGHGIGSKMHMEPDVPNFRERGRSARLKPGMVLAIEPMITAGKPANRTLADEWTVVTRDGSWAAHSEHTVAILDDGISVLSAPDSGALGLRSYEIRPICLD